MGQTILLQVAEEITSEPVPYATIVINGKAKETDGYGKYLFAFKDSSKLNITIKCFGYFDTVAIISPALGKQITLYLNPKRKTLGKVIIKGTPNFAVIEGGKITTNGDLLKRIPTVLSDPDPIKALQLMPGFNTTQENNTGIYIRGGNLDQTMVVLDDVPLFQTSHLSGYFSSFDANSIKQINVYKSGIPTKYGGRGSSVLDIRAKDGNMNSFNHDFSLGLMSARVSSSGYIKKDKLSYLVTARLGYPESIGNFLNGETYFTSYFTDGVVKLRYQQNETSFFTLSGFKSRDIYYGGSFLSERNYTDINNKLVSAKWYKVINKKLISNATVGYSSWKNGNTNKIIDPSYYSYGIQNFVIKEEFTYQKSNNTQFQFGINANQYRHHKSVFFPSNQFLDNPYINNGTEVAGYFTMVQQLKNNLQLEMGLRPSVYKAVLPFTHTAFNISPRIKLTKIVPDKLTTYFVHLDRSIQYQHLLSKNLISSLEDFWTSSNGILPEQKVNALSFGFNKKWRYLTYNAELFGKQFLNTFDYIDGANLQDADFYSQLAPLDKNYAFGFENSLSLEYKKLYAVLNYAYSRSLRQATEINEGNWYPSTLDRPHFLTALVHYSLGEKWDLNANFILQSGRAATIYFDKIFASKRNEVRFPIYHRMDLGFTYTKRPEKKKWQSSWVFSVYNAYNRQNTYALVWDGTKGKLQELTLFPILPTLSYNLKIR